MIDSVATPSEVKLSLEPIRGRVATTSGIDPRWIKAIISHESQWNMFCVRYEPSYRYLCHPEQFISSGLIDMATEVNTQKTSWGLGQIMGGLYREQGGKGFIAELLVPEVNLKHMAIRIAELMRRSKEPEYIFAGYNGGPGAMRKLAAGTFSNQRYVTSVLQYMSKLI